MKRTCAICRIKTDDQFTNHFETLPKESIGDKKLIIHVCESCKEEKSQFSEKHNMVFIEHDLHNFYPSSEIV